MKAFQIKKPGAIEALTPVELDEPRPGPHHACVQVRAVSLNYRDLQIVEGRYARPPLKPNLVPLSDGAGEVVEVGPGVTRVKTGDRVAGIFMQRWISGDISEEAAASALGGAVDGMLAEYVVLHEEGLVHVPPHLSCEAAATLPCAGVTAWHALVSKGRLTAGDTVVVQGTGGVSLFALQFARCMGARVIITSSSDEKLARVRRLGSSDGINYRTRPDWDVAVREMTGDVGADHVVEVGGGDSLTKSLSAVRHGGRISLIGFRSGAGEINPAPILRRLVTLQGIYVGSREMFEAMNRAITVHKLEPVIDKVFPFEDTLVAYRYFSSQTHVGKVCVRV